MKRTSLPLICLLALSLLLSGCGSASAEAVNLDTLLPAQLENAAGDPVSRDQLKGKLIGVYFSAGWCPPCRGFTPSLVEFRNKNADDFQVVFVSSDRSPAAQKQYMEDYKMDFLAIPYDSEYRRTLAETFSVRGIPTLVILDSKGKVITTNGRGELSEQGDKVLKTWQNKAS